MRERRSPYPGPTVLALLLALGLGFIGPILADAEGTALGPNPELATGLSVEYALSGTTLPEPDGQIGSSGIYGVAAAPTPAPAAPLDAGGPAAKPAWQDLLDGKVDSGVSNVSGPNASGKPAANGVAWVAGASGQAASLTGDSSYVGYAGARLKPDQGTILVRYRPIPDLVGVYAKRHDGWTDFSQNKPPQSGFLIDTIGWNAAPKGSYGVILTPGAKSTLNWGVWDGSKWHYATWTSPEGFGWDSNRWYELGFTWGPKGMSILVDGEQKAAIPDVVQLNTSLPWFLGQGPWYWPYGPHSLLGSYDDLRVYDEQLGPYAASAAAATPAAAPTARTVPAAAATISATPTLAVSPSGATSVLPVSPGRAPELATKEPTALGGNPAPKAALASLATPSPSPGSTAGGLTGALAANGGVLSSLAAKLPGGESGSVASTARQVDSLNLAGSLPGGTSGPVAMTVEKLPGGTPLFCGWPLLLAAALVVLLVGFLAGRGGHRRPVPTAAGRSARTNGTADGRPATDAPFAMPPPPPPAASVLPIASGAAATAAAPARFCDNCGNALEENVRFCGGCGSRID